jgi:hypothetical protein
LRIENVKGSSRLRLSREEPEVDFEQLVALRKAFASSRSRFPGCFNAAL